MLQVFIAALVIGALVVADGRALEWTVARWATVRHWMEERS
ncbi:MAG TPA: hypothetical protein VNL92_02280 [Dehalococcoidia bacterium]|nr:hypothetical protein [Dehalococcoidia bacterium]